VPKLKYRGCNGALPVEGAAVFGEDDAHLIRPRARSGAQLTVLKRLKTESSVRADLSRRSYRGIARQRRFNLRAGQLLNFAAGQFHLAAHLYS
jgi:hypothetical protein